MTNEIKNAETEASEAVEATPEVEANETAPTKGKKAKLVKCEINRDFWDGDGKRHRKGVVVEIPLEAALDGVESGALSRVKEGK